MQFTISSDRFLRMREPICESARVRLFIAAMYERRDSGQVCFLSRPAKRVPSHRRRRRLLRSEDSYTPGGCGPGRTWLVISSARPPHSISPKPLCETSILDSHIASPDCNNALSHGALDKAPD